MRAAIASAFHGSVAGFPVFGMIKARLRTHRSQPEGAGRMVGAKPPVEPKHIWALRTRWQIGNHVRDLAMFNLNSPLMRSRMPWKVT